MASSGYGRGDEREPLLSNQDGEDGGNGTAEQDLYSRLRYTIEKEQVKRDAQRHLDKFAGAQRLMMLAMLDKNVRKKLNEDQTKQYKALTAARKELATRDISKSPTVKYTIDTYRKQSTLKAKIDAAGGFIAFFFGHVAPALDFIITFFRSPWQVLTNVWANFKADSQTAKSTDIVGNNDAENPNSHYNQTMYNQNGDPASGPSLINIGSVILIALGGIVALIKGLYKVVHEPTLRTLKYFHEQRNEVNPDAKAFDVQAVEAELAARFKKAMKEGTLTVYLALRKQNVQASHATFIDPITALSNRKGVIGDIFRWTTSAISTVWGTLGAYSYIFWLAWMPFAMICGIGAVATALSPMMPFVLLITMIGGLAFSAYKLKCAYDAKHAPTEPVADADAAELARLAHETKVLAYIDAQRKGIAIQLKLTEQLTAKQPVGYSKDRIPEEIKNRVRGSLRKNLLDNQKNLHVFVTGLRGFIGGLLTVVFVGWFGSSLVGFLGQIPGPDIVTVPMGGIGGAIAGIFNSVIAIAQLRRTQLAYERVVEDVVQAEFRNTGKTVEQVFEEKLAQLEYRKSLVREAKGDDKDIMKFLDEIDPYSSDLSKFRSSLDALPWYKKIFTFTYIKKGLNRAFEFIFGGQTGAFVSRFFLLKGGLLAGALGFTVFTAGAVFWPLMAASIFLIVLVGALAVADYQMKSNQAQREDKLNTLHARIYLMDQKIEELCALQVKYGIDPQPNAKPDELVELEPAPRVEPAPSPSNDLKGSDHNILHSSASLRGSSSSSNDEVTSSPDDALFAASGEPLLNKAPAFTDPSSSQDTFFAPGKKLAQNRLLLQTEGLDVEISPSQLAAPAA